MSADALDDLIALSRWAGQQPNLTQSAGGNTSVKLDDGSLWIKASGFTLSEVGLAHGLSHVDVKKSFADHE